MAADPKHGHGRRGSSLVVTSFRRDTAVAPPSFVDRHRRELKYAAIITLVIFVHVWLAFAIRVNFDRAVALLVMVSIGWAAAVWYLPAAWIMDRFAVRRTIAGPMLEGLNRLWSMKVHTWTPVPM